MILAMGATAASGGFSAYNSYQQGVAMNKYYNAQADNAATEGAYAVKMADKQSNLIQDSASQEGKKLKTQQAEFNAATRAAMAANGVLGGATAEDIASSNFDKQTLDEHTLRYNADVKSWETRTQGDYNQWLKKNEAEDLRYQGKVAKSNAKKQVFTTLLSTAGSLASMGAGMSGGGGSLASKTSSFGGGTAPAASPSGGWGSFKPSSFTIK